jgi:hypothetical protein
VTLQHTALWNTPFFVSPSPQKKTMSDRGTAVIEWVNTFEGLNIESMEQLYTGQLMGQMLALLVPSFFGVLKNLEDTSENWALSASNIKKLLRMLEEYYKSVLEKGISDLEDIDVTAIVKDHDEDMLFSLLEIIGGVAVLCEDKSEFIQHIFSMDESSQLVLKEMIEHVMQRVYDLEEEEDEEEEEEEEEDEEEEEENDDSGQGSAVNELLVVAQEAITELKSEKQQLLQSVSDLTADNDTLRQELDKIKELEFQKDVTRDNDRSRAEANANAQSNLQQSLDEIQTKLTNTLAENEHLKQELESTSRQLEEHEHIRARLEVEALQMSDEIDLARDKTLKLAKAEAAIEKYQQKMEGLTVLKSQNKELEQNLDKYLEQIHELETASKTTQSTTKMVEKYKDKSVVLERERFEAISALEMKDDELVRMQTELKQAIASKNSMEEDLVSATTQLEMVESELAESREKQQGGDSGGMFETPAALKEKIRHLETELRTQASNAKDTSKDTDDSESAQSQAQSQSGQEVAYMIDVLKTELEVSQTAKKEREDSLVTVKRQLAESNHELKKALVAVEDASKTQRSAQDIQMQQANTKELETQLAIKVNALMHLEDLLKESETNLNKTTHDKEKLEIFAKRSLTSFKDKYMTALQRYKAEKTGLEEK